MIKYDCLQIISKGVTMMKNSSIEMLENGCSIKLSEDMLRTLQPIAGESLKAEIIEDRLILRKECTIEELFKDYTGENFDSKLQDLGGPVGNEKW